jgi:hypothetical protein
MRTIAQLVGALLVAAALAGAGAGIGASRPDVAASPWQRVTDQTGRNIDQVALARTRDGVLHVFWLRRRAGLTDLMHTPLGRGGPNAVVTGRQSLSSPDAVVAPDGSLRVFFISEREQGALDEFVSTATAGLTGKSWQIQRGVTQASTIGVTGDPGAAIGRDGTPYEIFPTTAGMNVHAGLDPSSPTLLIDETTYTYVPDLAVDGKTGEVVAGWFSLDRKEPGLFMRTVAPTLAPTRFVPASTQNGDTKGIDQRVAITGRIGAPGIYLAYGQGYPTFGRVLLWRYGGGKPMKVSTVFRQHEDVNIAAAPEGRLWVMWHSGERVYAVRTNRAATRLGAVVSIHGPNSGPYWKLAGEGSLGPLDVLISASNGFGAPQATWHARLLPGLSLQARRAGNRIAFSVTDAGDPVAGAIVTFAGRSGRTNPKGSATVTIGRGGTVVATAAKAGYMPASLRVKVA